MMGSPFNTSQPKPRHKRVKLLNGTEITFDSGHEFNVYKVLSASPAIEIATLQEPLLIKQGSYRYPEKSWRVDFTVLRKDISHPYFVEAKSYPTAMDKAFRLTLEMLDSISPNDVGYLLIVLPNSNKSSCATIAKRLGLELSQVTTLDGLSARLEIGCLL